MAQPSLKAVPDEVSVPETSAAYRELRYDTDLRSGYRIPALFLQNLPGEKYDEPDVVPLLAFINARSGGRAGPALARELSRAIGSSQVFDLSKHNPPDKVLEAIFRNVAARRQELADSGGQQENDLADMDRLHILAAGGDGTIAWLMGVVLALEQKFQLKRPPPIAIIPLGTGNDLSRTFGWGSSFQPKWIRNHSALNTTLRRIADATPVGLDCWRITLTLPSTPGVDYISPYSLPHALHPATPNFIATNGITPTSCPPATASSLSSLTDTPALTTQNSNTTDPPPNPLSHSPPVSNPRPSTSNPAPSQTTSTPPLPPPFNPEHASAATATSNPSLASAPQTTASTSTLPPAPITTTTTPTTSAPPTALQGMFWNYFSIGLDAKTANGFHNLREAHPVLARGRLSNQFWYSMCGCYSGWFGCSKPLAMKAQLRVLGRDGHWREVKLPPSVRAVVLVNLQSYAGGRNIWGEGSEGGFEPASFNDGLIEVVGFNSGWRTMPVMAGWTHGVRLAQGTGVQLRLHSTLKHRPKEMSHAYMQIDGEPWTQWIPTGDGDEAVVVEVTHAGRSVMLQPTQAHGKQQAPSVKAAAVGQGAVELATGTRQ